MRSIHVVLGWSKDEFDAVERAIDEKIIGLNKELRTSDYFGDYTLWNNPRIYTDKLILFVNKDPDNPSEPIDHRFENFSVICKLSFSVEDNSPVLEDVLKVYGITFPILSSTVLSCDT